MNKHNSSRGQAMIIGIMFVLFASLILIFGVSTPLLSDIRILGHLKNSNQSYFAAEGSLEDILLRVKKGEVVSQANSLTLNSATVTTTVSDVSGGKEILSEGSSSNRIRKVKTVVKVGDGVAFHYGVQTGTGGFLLGGNAGVYGNVYSNGNVVGVNGAFVTGSVIASNSSSAFADQINNSPAPSAGTTFGQTTAAQDIAQSFQLTNGGAINKVKINLRKTGTPGNLTVRIMTNSSGSPGSTVASTNLNSNLVTSSFGWVEAVFSTNPDLTAGNTYWLVLDGSNSASSYYSFANNNNYALGQLKTGRVGSSWSSVSPASDGYFEVYLGGIPSIIDNVDIGQAGEGDAHANTVQNSSIAGDLYCQTGSGNNKSCNTSLPDPSPQPFPISEANIDSWKEDALSGGTINGNYSVISTTGALGPKKIIGNLTVTNNATLTLNGTVWVTGNITLSNNATIRLASGYGEAGGILIADGWVDLSNNVNAVGSGESESQLLLLSTSSCEGGSTCGGKYAITVGNNADAVILNAQNGTLYLSNNTSLNAAVAKTLSMSNNATITYESGLADLTFSSGPSGGYELDSWVETE